MKRILGILLGITLMATPVQALEPISTITLDEYRQVPNTNSIFSEDYLISLLKKNCLAKIKIEQRSIITERLYEPSEFQWLGIINYNGWRWTWYTEQVLPGTGLDIPGRHANEDGYICDQDEYICLASSDLSRGTVVKTPFGYYGKVYDTGCLNGTLDVYTNW